MEAKNRPLPEKNRLTHKTTAINNERPRMLAPCCILIPPVPLFISSVRSARTPCATVSHRAKVYEIPHPNAKFIVTWHVSPFKENNGLSYHRRPRYSLV